MPDSFASAISHQKLAARLFLECRFAHFLCDAQEMSRCIELEPKAPGARRRYGKVDHAAALNYGDCFSYALAVTRGEPLLFKGEDFAKTDVNRRGETAVG
ncbi:type II toxin-antitoxin system VapC family toxin [Bradyrhizobium sp. ARR65]|uniref:type II toxin-antitoxin system VapC family toxin n=1 Tax=Bradyrhizobium sp. ARR65 TaxID=1040989 RepID=UPI001FD94282|nr:type II toxin-antitoxin system VapC family toxin [Bradyrhizobium sp. ARR65]